MGAKVKLNSGGMKALLNDPGVRADLTRRAGLVEAAAKASAPVTSGAYRDSIQIIQATTDRAVVRVGASVPYAANIEAGSGNLSRALGAAGL